MKKIQGVVFTVLHILASAVIGVTAQKIERIDIFDRVDNHLLFVTFAYDNNGKNTDRSIYTSDSTFLRNTAFVADGTGKTIREVSVDYNNDTLFTTDISSGSNSLSFSVFDQFGLDQLGGPMTLTESSSGVYSVSQSGTSQQYREEYVFNQDSVLSRINLYNTSNILIYYAAVTSTTRIHSGSLPTIRASASIMTGKYGKLRLQLALNRSAFVTMTIYNLSGRTVSVPLKKRLSAGDNQIAVAASAKNGKPLANGAYLVRLKVDNTVCFTAVRIIQR